MTKTARFEWSVRGFRTNHPRLAKILGCALPPMKDDSHHHPSSATSSLRGMQFPKELDLFNGSAKGSEDAGGGCCCKGECCCNNSIFTTLANDLSHFRNDMERRDLISIGAATGFAAAFGAPIGGLLFSLEEASSFFATTLLWKTLTATTIATFCLAIYRGDLSQYSVISLAALSTPDDHVFINRFLEMPLYAIVGAAGGLLGAIFNGCWKRMTKARKAIFYNGRMSAKARIIWKIAEVAFVSILTSTLMFVLPIALKFTCKSSVGSDKFESAVDGKALSDVNRFNCPSGQVNELGTIFFGSRDDAIKEILTDPSTFDERTLLTVGVVFFILMILTFGVSLPTGIFMPTVLIGSSLGGFAGLSFQRMFGDTISPSTFALLGAAALLTGLQRSTVSICVILVEGTGQTKILMPVIVTVVVARYVGDRFNHGLYEMAMEMKGYPFLDHHISRIYDIHKVSDVMSSPVRTVSSVERAGDIEKLLLRSSHHGFPVVEPITQKFLGIIRRDQLVALLECSIYMEMSNTGSNRSLVSLDSGRVRANTADSERTSLVDSPFMNLAYHIKDDRYVNLDESSRKLKTLEDEFDQNAWLMDNILLTEDEKFTFSRDETLPNRPVKRKRRATVTIEDGNLVVFLADDDRGKHVDVASVMNQGAYCITESCPLSKAQSMFTALGLRHLVVLGGKYGGTVVGMITRCNLDERFIKERTGCDL
uniref:Chloride channel protein n=1 Tax=Attheya septentrionalis TaxID=420275 RepID=A0A7S2XPI2_9STRA